MPKIKSKIRFKTQTNEVVFLFALLLSSAEVFGQSRDLAPTENTIIAAKQAYNLADFPAAYAFYSALDSVDSIVYYYDLWQFYVSAEKVRDTVKSKELLFRLAENNGFERFSLNQKFFEEIGLRDRPYWLELDSLIGPIP